MPPITTLEELATIYGRPLETSIVKEVDRIIPAYRALIAASPFAILATSGPEGLDCSPRGDRPGFASVRDDTTLLVPDRRGNNRVDSLKNIIRDPRIALLFLIPGSGTTLRVNGKARLTTDEDICNAFTVDERSPRCVIVVSVDAVYFQCARAIERSHLWNAASYNDPSLLPTPGQMLAALSDDRVGGDPYDHSWRERAMKTLW